MMLQRIVSKQRSIAMTSDAGVTNQDTDYAGHIQKVLHELRQMAQTPRLVTSPDDLEALEREIRQRTDHLGSLLVGSHLQQALDSTALQAEQERLVRQWPKPLKNDGKVKVWVRTAQGLAVPVWVTHIPPDLVVRGIPAHRKPPEVRIWRLRNQSAVGTRPPSTSTPH
jgi:hypothetical protein